MNKPIRVLQVVTHMNRGGLETMLMNYYRHIDRDRVQFDFLVHRDKRAAYDDEIEALGGKIYRLPRLVPWSVHYQKALNCFFDSHSEYKIVHVHQDCLSSVILKVAHKHGVPVRIAHSHNSNQDINLKYLIKMFYKQSIPRYANKLFACGQLAGEWMFGGAPFEVLNNAVDIKKYLYDHECARQIRDKLMIPQDAFVFGHIGRFSYQKNHSYLIDIFASVASKEPKAKLLMVGDGDLRPEMEAKVKVLGLIDRVIFTGVRSDVPELLQAMDVFVFPSLYEGLPVTIVEAQAAGLPCVISDQVPSDCAVTDLVEFMSLASSPEEWAERIIAAKGTPRRNTYDEVARAGFGIAENAAWLEKFYLSKQKEMD